MRRVHFYYIFFAAVAAGVPLAMPLVGTAQASTRYLVRQGRSSDCGPAALATLLHYYLGIPTSEAEMIRLTRPDLDTGTSFLGMEEAATAKGCVAGSFQMSYEKLKEQLATYPTPVIVRTLNPEPHFSLVLAVETDYVIVADPAIGNVLLPPKAFLSRWLIPKTQEGYVFMAVGPEPQANKAQINTAHSVQIAQELREQVRKLKAMRPPTPAFRR